MSRNNRAHHSENRRTDVLQFEKEKRKRRTSAHSKNRIIQKQNRATTCVSDEQNEKKKIKIVVIGGCKKSCVYGEIIFPDMNQICKNLLSDIATFMLSNFFSNNSIANPLHLIHVF